MGPEVRKRDDTSLSILFLEKKLENLARELQSALEFDTLEAESEELLSRSALCKQACKKHREVSDILFQKYLDEGIRDDANNLLSTSRRLRVETNQVISLVNLALRKLDADLISNIDTLSEASHKSSKGDLSREGNAHARALQPQESDSSFLLSAQNPTDRVQAFVDAVSSAQRLDSPVSPAPLALRSCNNVSASTSFPWQQALANTTSVAHTLDSPTLPIYSAPISTPATPEGFTVGSAATPEPLPSTSFSRTYAPIPPTTTSHLQYNFHTPQTTQQSQDPLSFLSLPHVSASSAPPGVQLPAQPARVGATTVTFAANALHRNAEPMPATPRMPTDPWITPGSIPSAPWRPAQAPGAAYTRSPFEDHYSRRDLLRRSEAPFDGNPRSFRGWIHTLSNRMRNVKLSAFDIICILEYNTVGEPLDLIRSFSTSSHNSEESLPNIWTSLHEQFGSDYLIATCLKNDLADFPPVKSADQGKKMLQLLNLCRSILCNMPHLPELSCFDQASGLRMAWDKLPPICKDRWRSLSVKYNQTNRRLPPFSVFVEFLTEQNRELGDPLYPISHSVASGKPPSTPAPGKQAPSRQARVLKTSSEGNTVNPSQCLLHETSTHSLVECNKFVKLPFPEKRALAVKHGLCFRCLGRHLASECEKKEVCKFCSGNHCSQMHRSSAPKPPSGQPSSSNKENAVVEVPPAQRSACSLVCGNEVTPRGCSKTLLVDVMLPSKSNKVLRCYCIIDEQSNGSYADPKLIDFFNIDAPEENYNLTTLHGLRNDITCQLVDGLEIRGVGESTTIKLPQLRTNSSIPDTKEEVASPEVVAANKEIAHLACNFNPIDKDAEVLLLLGYDSEEVMATRCLTNSPPFAHHTAIGYALVGLVCPYKRKSVQLRNMRSTASFDHEHFVAKPSFDAPRHTPLPLCCDVFQHKPDDELPGHSQEDSKFLELISDSISISKEGNLTMPLPFKGEDPQMPNNKMAVFHRTKNTLHRLKKDEAKLRECVESMGRNIAAGHVEAIPPNDPQPEKGKAWWLPVFPVTNERKGKVRLVFDSSAQYSGTSLNHQLMQGPDENNRLRGVLLRFRIGEIGFSTDIEAMFHQFHLTPKDKNFLRFFWFKENDPSLEPIEYRATVHIFGNKPSPAIANFGLRYTTTHPDANKFPKAQEFIKNHFYVDDGLSSANDPHDAIAVIKEAKTILGRYNVRLHKINSSSPEVLQAFPQSDLANRPTLIQLEDSPIQRTLGVAWNTENDEFVFQVDIRNKPFTRRGVLSVVNSLFDPLGMASPITLAGRLLQRKVIPVNASDPKDGWDDPLPPHFIDEWKAWKESLATASQLAVPRSLQPKHFGKLVRRELHVFADASDSAIGCALYVRSTNSKGDIYVAFLIASSKIAPRSAVSIPRLELCAALEATTMANYAKLELEGVFDKTTFYSDSKVVLGYLNNSERRFSRYVSRRTSLILKGSQPGDWQYVPTDVNPADIASRPHSPVSLAETCWFQGPSFLWEPTCEPFTCSLPSGGNELPETLEDKVCLRVSATESQHKARSILSEKSWERAIDAACKLLLKAATQADSTKQKQGFSPANENMPSREAAQTLLVQASQSEAFADVINSIKNGKDISHDSIASLSPFLDDKGVLRVGGRLRQASLPVHVKFPILLPSSCNLTSIILQHYHEEKRHQGRHITLGAVRDAGFYVLHGSKRIRNLIENCITCRKLRGKCEWQKMSDLPPDRLEESPPFTNTGIDVFGPFLVSEGHNTRRNSSTRKIWGLIFSCLVTRAVHLESLSSLDTSTFKNAFRRFLAIRGACKKIRSDRGTNFIGAKNQDEAEFSFDELKSEVESRGCAWELNTPHASHFGGAWERQIGSIKRILAASLLELGPRSLSRDELDTLLQEAASVVNNTPMWEISSRPDDPLPLSPAMLLTLRDNPNPAPLEDFGPRDLLAYGKRRWRRVQHLADHFWQRWRREYVHTLQQRRKWRTDRRPLKPGDTVLLKSKNLKRNLWNVGTIKSTKPSVDGAVRSAVVSISNEGTIRSYERPICDMVLLHAST